ncbi:MAG: hypothetical protein QOC71_678 [Thermoplasmata archaeon]|jgi:hypothetical protein|nr:hypothetical protein [Thermoplasmata archaeon]
MNTEKLAPVFLDNKPVSLNDPKPKVSAILTAGGRPEATDVKWLQFQPNTQGKPLRSEEVLDRTSDPSKPIYLTSAKLAGGSASGKGHAQPAQARTSPANDDADDDSSDQGRTGAKPNEGMREGGDDEGSVTPSEESDDQ